MILSELIKEYVSGDWGNEEPNEDTPNEVFCIRAADFVSILSVDYTSIPTRYVGNNSFESKQLKVGDIVIEKSGGSPTQSTGRVIIVTEELLKEKPHIVCSNFCEAFRVKEGWNPFYVFSYLQFIYNEGVFFNFEGKTSGLKNLQMEQAFCSIDIPEQRCDISILSSIDKKVAINRKANMALESLAKQIYDYWFVQFDFPNEEGKPYKSSGGKMVWNETLKREVPEGWEDGVIKQFIQPIERGVSYSTQDIVDNTGCPMINLACYTKKGDYRGGKLKYYSGEIKECEKVLPYDMLIACTDMTPGADIIGRPILVTEEYKWFVYSMDLAKITPINIDKYYLYYSLRTPFYHNYIKPFASGTNVKHLDIKGVENYMLLNPITSIQKRFGLIITNLKKKQMNTINEINELQSLRDYLLPLLMNGQVTIKD